MRKLRQRRSPRFASPGQSTLGVGIPLTPLFELSPSSLQERLWNQAYDGVKGDEPKIAEAYERLLSATLQDDGDTPLASNNQDQHTERGRQMERLVEIGLRRADKAAAAKTKVADGVETVMTVKDLVRKAVQAVPAAAVAWVGVCFALEVLSNSVTESSADREGLAYVVIRMSWYWNLVDLLLDTDATRELHGVQGRLENHILRLYRKLLIYQMKSVCIYHQNQGVVFLKDMIKLDDWQSRLDDIKDAEALVLKDSEQYNSQRVQTRLRDLAATEDCQYSELQLITSVIQEQTWQTRRLEQIFEDKDDLECMRNLHITDPEKDKARIQDTKGGLLRDSYAWVLKTPNFEEWQTSDCGLLWIRGDPGKGKTMLICGIVDELRRHLTSRPAYFFCQDTNQDLNNANAVLRGLIFSLVRQQPRLISYVRKEYDPVGPKLFEGSNVWVAMSKILTAILTDPSLGRTVLVVDALDECGEGRRDLLKLIVQSASRGVKWAVSSRNWPDIQEQLDAADQKVTLRLELNEKLISAAVEAYIDHKVGELAERKEYNKELQKDIQQTLIKKADSTFLWVSLVCEELSRTSPWNALKTLHDTPSGLEALYERMMQQIIGSDDEELCTKVLAAASVVDRPVSVKELAAVLELPPYFTENPAALNDLVASCGSFLTLRENAVSLVHPSAKDFLLSRGTIHKILPHGVQQTLLREGPPDGLGSERTLGEMHNVSEQMKGVGEYTKSPSSEGLSAGLSSVFDQSGPPASSITTRDASSSAAFSNQVPIESSTQKSGSMNGSSYSIHSGAGSLLGKLEPYVVALTEVFFQHLGGDSEDSEDTGLKTLATLLPEFAFRMSSQGNTDDHRAIAWIVSKQARSIVKSLIESSRQERDIIRILASVGQSSPPTTEHSSDDQDSSDDGRSSTVQELKEQLLFRLGLRNREPTQLPSDLEDCNVLALEEPDDVDYVRIERCRDLLTGSHQMDWLKRMIQAHRALNLAHESSLDLVGRSVKSAIDRLREHIGHATADISRKRGPSTYRATISLDWSPLAFVRAQEYHHLDEDLLERVLTLTGGQEMAQACTAAEYMAQVWPTAGARILRLLSKLVLAPDSVQVATLDDDTKVVAHLHQNSLKVTTTGTRFGLTRTAEQLAWIGSAMQSPPETSGMTAFTCKISSSSSRFEKLTKGTMGSLDPVGSFDYSLHFQVDPLVPSPSEGDTGYCWHDMFRNFVIAEGFPIPNRQDPTPGLESSFEVIARLIRAQWFSAFAGGLFVTTTAGTMLYAARVANKTDFWWHYMADKEGQWISYPDAPKEAYTLGPQDQLDKLSERIRSGNARHFFGWSRRIRNFIGSSAAGYRIQTPRYKSPPSTLGVEKVLIGLAKEVSLQIEVLIGRKDTPKIMMEHRMHHKSKIQSMKSRYVVLYDLQTQVAWLSDGASALLHLLRRSISVRAENPSFVTLAENDDLTVDKAQASYLCLTDPENMKKTLWENVPGDAGESGNETVQRRIDTLYDGLAKIRPAIRQALSVKGYQMDLSFKCCLMGFDFNQIAKLDLSCEGRAVQLQASANSWIQLTNALEAPVLFGMGFGDLFQVSNDLETCTRCLWNARIPRGLDLLAISENDLCQIMREHGHNGDDFHSDSYTGDWLSVYDDIYWKNPKRALGGCLCRKANTSSRFMPWHRSAGSHSTRNILQTLEILKDSKRRHTVSSGAGPSEISPDSRGLRHGAVLFGSQPVETSDKLRYFFSRGGDIASKDSDSSPRVAIADQIASSAAPSVATAPPERDRPSSQTSSASPHLTYLASAQPSQDLSFTPATSASTHTQKPVNQSGGGGAVPDLGGAGRAARAGQAQPVVPGTSRLRHFKRFGWK